MSKITTGVFSVFKVFTKATFLTFCFLYASAALWSGEIPASHGIPDWEKLTAPSNSGTAESPAVIDIPQGVYHFDSEKCQQEENYYSNSELTNPKTVALSIRNLNNAVLDFHDSELLGYGLMTTLVVEDCHNLTIKNFRVDAPRPPLYQIEIIANSEDGITFRPMPWVGCRLENGLPVFESDHFRATPSRGMAFEPITKHVLHNVADPAAVFEGTVQQEDGTFRAPNWKDTRLVPGTMFVLRPNTYRETGIFLHRCVNLTVENVSIHYAPAKAVTVQRCENVHLDGVSIRLREGVNPRVFTANTDAIHCSCNRGEIIVENGLYEGMMDDAINVHGAYLKVVDRLNDRQIEAAYSHSETSGFEWGIAGDTVQFNRADTMEIYDGTYHITEITPVDAPTAFGASRFRITVDKDLPACVNGEGNCGIENVSETPSVIYRNNVIRNNRARGGLFSTSQPVLIEGNRFDHVSGTALLFCGDCSGWYESGPCRNVVVRNNQFIDCMGSLYQFCRGIISIYPEIPNLAAQKKYYYGGTEDAFVFEHNTFETFDKPILYVRSADGVVFRNNLIIHNNDYPPISTDPAIILDKANRVRIYGNRFDVPFRPAEDILKNDVPEDGIRFTADEPF